MNNKSISILAWARKCCLPHFQVACLIVLFAGALLPLLQGCASDKTGGARAFKSPQEAVDALTRALRAQDTNQLLAIVGPDGEEIISSGDDVADQQRRAKFLALYDQKHSLVNKGPESETLVVGNDDWPLPVPIVLRNGSWFFDCQAGKDEILNRRIGENELSAIQICKAIGDAQHEFALKTLDADGVNEYARQFASDPGKHNGLYWPTAVGEDPSPMGELIAHASAEGYKRKAEGPTAYHGYCFRILEAQGPHAPDGALNYVVNGKMTLGFALVAYPADYNHSGIMTFIMSSDGVVYQKDLGDQTDTLARNMKEFDPDESWTKVE